MKITEVNVDALIADALLICGIQTEDIMSPTRRQVHTLTPFAKVRGTAITYPAEVSPSAPKKPSRRKPIRPARDTSMLYPESPVHPVHPRS